LTALSFFQTNETELERKGTFKKRVVKGAMGKTGAFHFKLVHSIFFVLIFCTSPLLASIQCGDLLSGQKINGIEPTLVQPVVESKAAAQEHLPQQPVAPHPLNAFSKDQVKLEGVLQRIPEKRRAQISHLFAAVEFFDFQSIAKELWQNFLEGKRGSFNFSNLYDRRGIGENRGAPLNGFLRAKAYLKTERPKLSIEILAHLHRLAMADGVEGISYYELGAYRKRNIFGNAVGDSTLTRSEVLTIEANPYLQFYEEGIVESKPSDQWAQVSLWGVQPQKQDVSPESPQVRIVGKIIYPSVDLSRNVTIALIQYSHPQLFEKIMNLRRNLTAKTPIEQVNTEFVKALTEARFAQFMRDREALGILNIGQKKKQYIELVADFQRDLVAIHPFSNGNGRTTRLLMNYLLSLEGLPAAYLVDPNLDIQVSQQVWRDHVRRSVLNSARLVGDVLNRLENGLTVEHSPFLLFPGISEAVRIDRFQPSPLRSYENAISAPVEPNQFTAFVKSLIAANPGLAEELYSQKLQTIDRVNSLFVEYFRSKTISYIHKKDGERVVGLRFVEQDFIDQFGVTTASHLAQYRNKISKWFDKDMLVWRGLADKNHEFSDAELVDYFRKPSLHLASNQVLRGASSAAADIVSLMKKDFLTYNSEMLNGDLIEMANDHHKTGSRYGTSYGYSTSKREIVGKAFAMGAMVIGEYGNHKDPELQQQLKSRINIAAFRAQHDVDLGRLKAFDSSFSYIYGRQAEVMGIGGADPDAVQVVQRINELGEVIHTLLRNPRNPNEILKLEGRFVPGEGVDLSQAVLLETFILVEPKVEVKAPPSVKTKVFDRIKRWFGR
jgi:hypothetical protein